MTPSVPEEVAGPLRRSLCDRLEGQQPRRPEEREGRARLEGSRRALVACGAIAQPAARVIAAQGWAIDVHPLPPLLHNRPQLIAGQVEELAVRLRAAYDEVAVGYADCGTYGALDEVCERLALRRLPGLHCYDVFAGPETVEALTEAEPGTYLLTDFLVRSFARTVAQELGLDRYPELLDDYFRHYTRVVWLAQSDDATELAELRPLAQDAADRLGLPLHVVPTGTGGLTHALRTLLPEEAACPA